jgi:hypothetical protein
LFESLPDGGVDERGHADNRPLRHCDTLAVKDDCAVPLYRDKNLFLYLMAMHRSPPRPVCNARS